MSQQINFQQLVDLAFGLPSQDGIMNVKYLHALLHGLVHRLEVNNIKVELKGGHFSNADELIKGLHENSFIQVAEYEVQKNDSTGKFDKKKQVKQHEVEVDTVMVLRDVNQNCGNEKPDMPVMFYEGAVLKVMCDDLKTRKDKTHTPLNTDNRLDNVEKCLAKVLQKCEIENSSDTPDTDQFCSQLDAGSCASNTSHRSSSTLNQSPGGSFDQDIASDVDTRLLSCIQQMTEEIDQIKRQLCTTQKCLSSMCEKSKVLAVSTDETDIKFDELMKLFDDYDKRVSRNCADICACHKQIEDNIQRIDTIYEEVETLYRVKGDKDEIDACLAKKANKCELELKVDVETFDHVKRDLSEAILDSHYRLKVLSNELDARVKQICQCLNTKIDREAFSSFARCVEDRIKQISNETKKWMNVKKKEVCPFTRTPFAQNLQCGACNQPVVMRGVEGNVPLMPCLSQITWNCHTKSLTCQRAGGRHTVTTAQQRCPKQSNFYEYFKGPTFVTSADCIRNNELHFPDTCFDAMNQEEKSCEKSETSMEEECPENNE